MGKKVIDPTDGKTEYPSYKELLRHYTRMPGTDQIGMLFDMLFDRPDLGNPSATLKITGSTMPVKVAHGLKDADGNKAKPRAWHIIGVAGTDHVNVVSVDDTNIEVDLSDKGTVTLQLYV